MGEAEGQRVESEVVRSRDIGIVVHFMQFWEASLNLGDIENCTKLMRILMHIRNS